MANEYAVNQADLTAVADAIREKGGTSDVLTFPGGFVDAVGAIQAGGDNELLFSILSRTVEGEVVFPNGLVSLGQVAMRGCNAVTSVILPDTLESLGSDSLAYIAGLTRVEFGNGIKFIGDGSLRGTGVVIDELPPTLTDTGSYVFVGCKNITISKIPEGVRVVRDGVFQNCTGITHMEFHSGVTQLFSNVFSGCTNLTSITFNSTLTQFRANSLYNCPNLTTINVPWAEGEVANAPWGATNATINYNYVAEEA